MADDLQRAVAEEALARQGPLTASGSSGVDVTGSAASAQYEFVRWNRYGHDRLYIKRADEKLGHLDLRTGELVVADEHRVPALLATLRAAGHTVKADLPPAVPAASSPTDREAESLPALAVDCGRPGASLQEQADRQRAKREAAVRAAHPRIGGFLLRMQDEPVRTRNLAQGAAGERHIAARLEELCGPSVSFLHNRLCGVGRRDGDIDHIAIAPSGVYVVDAKYYPGASVEVRRWGGLLSPRVEELFIRGRNKTSLLVSVQRQHAAVKAALADLPGADVVPVFSAFCFLDADLPLLWSERISGVPLLGPRRMAKLIRQDGPMNEGHRQRLLEHLAAMLPSAG